MRGRLPRGIAPDLLISQVKNTLPYIADLAFLPAAQTIIENEGATEKSLSHFEYFRLCVSAHFLSCGTPVPTDVDNQIRRKLWDPELPLETALEMSDLVLSIRGWDFSKLSARFTFGAKSSPFESQMLSGHLGEWFTVATGAYCALKHYSDPLAETKRNELLSQLIEEIDRHSDIFGSLWRAGDGLNSLKASASIAHNFGDLDRVMDMWELGIEDPLRLQYYKLTALPFDSNKKLRFLGRLWVAGELYKATIGMSSMALENHRHFALRKPKCLRESPKFQVPTGPFFDEWGKVVSEDLNGEPLSEVIEALTYGWQRLPKTVGYGRALRSLAATDSLDLKAIDRNQRKMMEMSQEQFEKTWADQALVLMDEIPSRA